MKSISYYKYVKDELVKVHCVNVPEWIKREVHDIISKDTVQITVNNFVAIVTDIG
jgi:hypothetical protein